MRRFFCFWCPSANLSLNTLFSLCLSRARASIVLYILICATISFLVYRPFPFLVRLYSFVRVYIIFCHLYISKRHIFEKKSVLYQKNPLIFLFNKKGPVTFAFAFGASPFLLKKFSGSGCFGRATVFEKISYLICRREVQEKLREQLVRANLFRVESSSAFFN